MKVIVLAHINTWEDGIPCYGTVVLFTDRQKAIDWLKKEYVDEFNRLEDILVSDEEIADAENSCTFGPIGWTIWEDEIQ